MTYDDGAGSMPSWNGNPTTFRDYKQKVLMWKHSVELSKKRSWAAALAMKLTGEAHEAVMAFSDADWTPWEGQQKMMMGGSK